MGWMDWVLDGMLVLIVATVIGAGVGAAYLFVRLVVEYLDKVMDE